MAQSYTGDYTANGESAEKIAAKASEALEKAKGTAEDFTSSAKQKATEAAHAVAEKTGEMAGRIQHSTAYTSMCRVAREQPLATLAGAIAVGVMAGALWKLSRKQTTAEKLTAQVSSFAEPHLRSLRRNIWG